MAVDCVRCGGQARHTNNLFESFNATATPWGLARTLFAAAKGAVNGAKWAPQYQCLNCSGLQVECKHCGKMMKQDFRRSHGTEFNCATCDKPGIVRAVL